MTRQVHVNGKLSIEISRFISPRMQPIQRNLRGLTPETFSLIIAKSRSGPSLQFLRSVEFAIRRVSVGLRPEDDPLQSFSNIYTDNAEETLFSCVYVSLDKSLTNTNYYR